MIGKLALLCGACSLGVAPVALGTNNAEMPPVRFRGNSAAIVIYLSPAQIQQSCGEAPKGMVTVACTRRNAEGAVFIFMPNPCLFGETDFYAKIACHENAHNLGWSGEHEL